MKQHLATIDISDGYLCISIDCPYDFADESRPCWPYGEPDDNGEAHPDPAPQEMCTWVDWCDNSSPEETLYGDWRLPAVPIDVDEWDEGPHFILGAVKVVEP